MEFALAAAVAAPRGAPSAFAVEHLNAMVVEVGDIHVAKAVGAQRNGAVELAVLDPCSAPRTDEAAVFVEFPNAIGCFAVNSR